MELCSFRTSFLPDQFIDFDGNGGFGYMERLGQFTYGAVLKLFNNINIEGCYRTGRLK